MKKLWSKFFVLLAICLVIWLFLKRNYKFYYYKIDNCTNTSLTVIEYSEIGERGLILAKGIHKRIPESNYIIDREMSGFDSYFECIVTCEGGVIMINQYTNNFDPDFKSKDIVSKVVEDNTYDSLRNSNSGKLIKIY